MSPRMRNLAGAFVACLAISAAQAQNLDRPPGEGAGDWESERVHTSYWHLDGEPLGATDVSVLAVTPFGFWITWRLDADVDQYRPWLRINGERVPYPRTHLGGYASVRGRKGTWAGPVYYTELEPETPVELSVQQPSGGWTEPVEFTTRTVSDVRSKKYALSDATRANIELSDTGSWRGAVARLPAFKIPNQGAQKAYSAGLFYALTGRGRDQALRHWQASLDARKGVNKGNAHRWFGAHLAWSTGILAQSDVLTQADINRAAELMIDDLEANVLPRYDDSDRLISETQIGFISGMMGVTLLEDGPLKSRYEKIYQHYLRMLHGVQLPMMRINHRFGVAGGWTLDGTGYGLGTMHYWMELIWILEQTQPELIDRYLPYLVNAAYMQIHLVAPDRNSMFSFGDLEENDLNQKGTQHNAPQANVRSLLAYLLARRGRLEEANHLRALLDEYRRFTAWAPWLVLLNDAQKGPGRIKPTYINLSGDAAAVYARTGWTQKDSAIMFQFGWGGTHHGHADIGQITWFDRGYKTHDKPGYGLKPGAFQFHNVPAGQRNRHSAPDGGGTLTEFSVNDTKLVAAIAIDNAYPVDVTRRIEWDKSAKSITVSDTGAEQGRWLGSATVEVVDAATVILR